MAFLLLLSSPAQSAPITAPWTLTVGGADVSPFVLNGGRFVEKASSTDGLATFTLNGAHETAVAGAPILLSAGGYSLWEGTVTSATPQHDSQGNQVATMVLAAPLSAQLDVATHYVVTEPTDVATVAQSLCAQTPVPFGSQTSLGSSGGTLSIQNVASGLTVAALIARMDWRVQDGSVTFVGPDSFTALSSELSGMSASGSSVVVLGGLDSQTKQPLKASFATQGTGAVLQASHPEVSDHDTLNAAGAALAQRYGANAITTTVTLDAGTVVRAGDWFIDSNGNAAVAHQVEHKLVSGFTVPTVSLGYPQLPVASPVTDSIAQRSTHYPPARLANDFLVRGADLSYSGLQVTFTTAQIVLAGSPSLVLGTTLTLDPNSTALVTVSGSGFAFADSTVLPAPGTAVPLYVITTSSTGVIGWEDVAPRGGVGSYHLMPANPANTPSVSAGSITVVAEGAASAKATVPFTISGLTLDQTIGSIEVVQSFAGQNSWGNPHTLVWSPTTLSYTDERHGLAAGQGYDIAINILGRDGNALNVSPLVIGTSPTIASSAINAAIATWNEFGGTLQTDGSWTNVDGKTSSRRYGITTGSVLHAQAVFSSGGSGNLEIYFDDGTGQNGYFCAWNVASGLFQIGKNVSGTPSEIVGQSYHNPVSGNNNFVLKFTLTVGASNDLEASIDSITLSNTDSSVPMAGNNAAITVNTAGSSGSIKNWQVINGTGHFSVLPPRIAPIAIPPWDTLPADNSPLASGIIVGRHFSGAASTDTSPFVDSSGYTLHGRMSSEYQVNFDSSGNIQKSTTFIDKTPNTVAYVTDATFEWSWTGTGPYSVSIWYDNGTAGSDATVIFPDGSPSINLGHSTSSTPSYSNANVTSGTNFYAVLHTLNGTTTMTVQTSPFTTAQFASYFADGGIVPAAAQTGTPLFTASGSGGSGSISGGGGGHTAGKV